MKTIIHQFPMQKIAGISKILFISATLISCGINSKNVPTSVQESFSKKFPNAKDVDWEKENDTEYEAHFKINEAEFSANFLNSGKWLETESNIDFNNLPEKVQSAFKTSHSDEKIKAVAKIETSEAEKKYEVEVKKGLKTVEYFYNEEGNLIK